MEVPLRRAGYASPEEAPPTEHRARAAAALTLELRPGFRTALCLYNNCSSSTTDCYLPGAVSCHLTATEPRQGHFRLLLTMCRQDFSRINDKHINCFICAYANCI